MAGTRPTAHPVRWCRHDRQERALHLNVLTGSTRGLPERVLAFANETRHRAPHEPSRKLLRESGKPFDDHRPTPNSGFVLDLSQPDTVEERQVRTNDEIGIEPRGSHTNRNLPRLEQQPHASAARAREVELNDRTPVRQELS